jgi:hypothetical protein
MQSACFTGAISAASSLSAFELFELVHQDVAYERVRTLDELIALRPCGPITRQVLNDTYNPL